jgi:Alpha/beta hydrolase domain
MPTLSRSRGRRSWLAVASLVVVLAAAAGPADARITSIVINSQQPAYGGASFGSVGPYEQLDGTAFGEIDPNHPLNAVIQDMALAPRNDNGMVEYSMLFSILKPVDMTKANGTLIYDVVNRGNKRINNFNIGGNTGIAPGNQGDGLLHRHGFTMVASGWEHDITSGIRLLNVPVAKNPDGSSITGRVRGEFIFSAPATTENVSAPPPYVAVSTDNTGATLTKRVRQHDPKAMIPNDQWAFADCRTVLFPGTPDPTRICLNGGFDTNHIYELVYTAKDPVVAGIGFAATRDFISFLRYGSAGVTNPLGDGSIDKAIIFGSSQSGRWIRTSIQLGFNQDEARRIVSDGAIPHIASARGAFNVRWAQPTRLSGTQHTEAQFPGPETPMTWATTTDPISGVKGSQLDRCKLTRSCPKIMQTMSDTEFWQASMSLNITDQLGRHDVPVPADVRVYQFSSTHHGGGNPLQQPPAILPAVPAACQLRANSNPYVWHQRALLLAMNEWITKGTKPPDGLYSSLRRKSLVPASEIVMPYVPAVNFTLEGLVNQKIYLDRGPEFNVEDISGVMAEPPVPGPPYANLVPQVNEDGNDTDGLRNVNVQVPLGTYTGWNIRKAGFSEGDSCDLTGAFIPFFRTQAERLAAGDPRLSLEERYPTHADYVAKVTAAANGLVKQRLLLQEDADKIIAAAQAAQVP